MFVAILIKRRSARHSQRRTQIRVLQATRLKKFSWLVHGFSTRSGGFTRCYGGRSLNLGFTKEDDRDRVERNRKQLLLAVGAASKGKPWPLVTLRQVHSDIIHVVRTAGKNQLVGDGLVTNLPGIALGVQTADCLPVLLMDKKNKAVGAFHAGWRGTAKRIVEKGVGTLRNEYGSLPEDIHAVIGPGIQKCCYVVGEELRQEFRSQFSYAEDLFHEIQESDLVREKYPMLFLNARAPGHGDPCIAIHLDLREANQRQLLAVGVPGKQISSLEDCTACNPRRLFSHRADKGHTGRMMAMVGIKP